MKFLKKKKISIKLSEILKKKKKFQSKYMKFFIKKKFAIYITLCKKNTIEPYGEKPQKIKMPSTNILTISKNHKKI